jgi:hypothetical protein
LPEEWKESFIVPICQKGDKTDCSKYRGISVLSAVFKILSNNQLSRFTPYAEEIIEVLHCGFQWSGQLVIMYSAFVKYLGGEKWEYNEAVLQLFTDFKKGNGSVRREVLCNVLIQFGILMKLVRIKKSVGKTYGRVQAGICLTCCILRVV